MIDKEKTCTACSGSGHYCGSNCGACNGTGLEYSKDDIIEALEAELKKLQNTSSNWNGIDEGGLTQWVIDRMIMLKQKAQEMN